jgi:hypothetical protein
MRKPRLKHLSLAALLAFGAVPAATNAGPYGNEDLQREPSGAAMFIDALLVRPIMIGTTLVGSALFVISLPFSALGGNVDQAAENLVVEPATSAFKRPLGEYE